MTLGKTAEFRETENFYPLQLEIYLKEELVKMDLTKDNIKFATPEDADDWMELVSLTIDGYPCLDKEDYVAILHQYIVDKKALILRERDYLDDISFLRTFGFIMVFLLALPRFFMMSSCLIYDSTKYRRGFRE